MPSDGAVTLADVRAPTLSIVCERCGRYGRYDVKRLIALHGADARLPDLLAPLANCEKARSVTLSTFVSPTDGVSPPNGTPLDTATFTGLGTETLSTVDNPGAGLYSLQEVFVIHATGAGDTNLSIDLTSSVIPEPSTWAMMLLGFAGLGFLGYRQTRRAKPQAALA